MKILHICPTFDTPTCGIGKYTHYLAAGLKELGCEQIVAQGFLVVGNTILQHRPDVVHIQLEYGFCTPQRLRLIDEVCHREKIKLVTTFHSLAQMPHNVAMPDAVKLAHTALAMDYGRFRVIPSGIPKVEGVVLGPGFSLLTRIFDERQTGRKIVLFFGQAHPHKQLLETIQAVATRDDMLLVCVVSKPVQGNVDYYDHCKTFEGEKVVFAEGYLSDEEVITVAHGCDAAIFPYREYGTIGVSAAVKLLLNLPTLPILVSHASHFSDVPLSILPREGSIQKMLDFISNNSARAYTIAGTAAREQWVKSCRFDQVARLHYEIYSPV